MPSEKFKNFGLSGLSDTDLVSILIGTGGVGVSFKEVSKDVAKILINDQSPAFDDLIKVKGVGETKALRIISAFEIARRMREKDRPRQIRSDRDSYEYLKDKIGKKAEEVWAIYLNARYEIISCELIAKGRLNTVNITPRDILGFSLLNNSNNLVIAHNHPSGNSQVSYADKKFTIRLMNCCELMGVNFVSHIVIGNGEYSVVEIDD